MSPRFPRVARDGHSTSSNVTYTQYSRRSSTLTLHVLTSTTEPVQQRIQRHAIGSLRHRRTSTSTRPGSLQRWYNCGCRVGLKELNALSNASTVIVHRPSHSIDALREETTRRTAAPLASSGNPVAHSSPAAQATSGGCRIQEG